MENRLLITDCIIVVDNIDRAQIKNNVADQEWIGYYLSKPWLSIKHAQTSE